MVNAFAGLPLSIGATVVLTRELGVEDFGRYAVFAFLVPTLTGLLDIGLTMGFMQRGALAYGAADLGSLRRVAGEALTWALVRFPFVMVIVALVLRDFVAVCLYLLVAAVSVFTSGVGLTLIATVRLPELSRLALLGSMANAISTIAAALAGLSPARIYAAGLAVQYAVLATQILYLRDDPLSLRACLTPRKLQGVRRDLSFGTTTYFSSQLASLTLSRSELLFFGGRQQVDRGSYAGAYTVASRLTLPIDALYGALPTSLTTLRAREGAFRRGAEQALRLSGCLFSLASGPCLVVAVVGAELVLPTSFKGATVAVLALSAGSLLVSGINPLLSIYFARRRARPLLSAAALALCLNLSLSAVLIPRLGLSGAVIANVASAFVYVSSLIVPLARDAELGPTVRRYTTVLFLPVLGATAGGLALAVLHATAPRVAVGLLLALAYPLLVARVLPSVTQKDVDALLRQTPVPVSRVLGRLAQIIVPRRSPTSD